MSKSFISNFKTLMLIVAKSASTQKDCPIAYSLMCSVIESIFSPDNDEYNRKAYRKYKNDLEKRLESEGHTLKDVFGKKDRSIFSYIDSMMPLNTPEILRPHLKWLSMYMCERMEDKHMDAVFRYIKVLNSQC